MGYDSPTTTGEPVTMPAYAGFANIQDYLEQRLRREKITQNAFSEAMGWRRNYINSVVHSLFAPSRRRCDEIAKYFGDDPHLVRVLAGHESAPPDLEDKQTREIYDLMRGLNPEQRRKVIKLIKSLLDGSA